MRSSYKSYDVTILLKDITGMVTPQSTEERERLIQSGTHYCEMLPIEYEPTEKYMEAYRAAVKVYSAVTAKAVASVAEKIYAEKGSETVLVSLARAGTSIGVLIKHFLDRKYSVNIPHYTISIIRGKGIDCNAMKYILARHKPHQIQFVDGWVGKGAIQRTLDKSMHDYPEIDPKLAVLSDPALVSGKCGTTEDFLIASSCLNSTVSGLISRTFLRSDIIGENDFHGAMYYESFKDKDLTYNFINSVEEHFDFNGDTTFENESTVSGVEEVMKIAEEYSVSDINLVKPGIGETTRVLLRRVPWKILVHSLDDNEHLGHIYQLAKEKGVEVAEYPLKSYKACGIIRKLADT
ncbi:MAG: cysteine protease StiP family protein [Oscillospiraceae bacterium]|nr:cysteine protease StiP family protein [Oscillospiraceae bacterium]